MKHLITIFFALASFAIQAQVEPGNISPGGNFDRVFDQNGNKYSLDEIKIIRNGDPGGPPKALMLCSSGYFDLYFETGSGMEGNSTTEMARRNLICQVFSDISNFIQTPNPSVKVNILIKNINTLLPNYNPNTNPNPAATSGVLGLASGFYVLPSNAPSASGIADNEIWKTINSGTDSYTNVVSPLIASNGAGSSSAAYFYHGMAAFNFNNPAINWHLDLSNPTATGLYDLYTVALHEITHALGFASLISANGTSKFGTGFNYYSRYDQYLKTAGNVPLITNSGGCSMYNYGFNPSLNTNVMAPSTFSCSTQIKFAGSVNQSAYTPATFTNESSLSHLEDLCHLPAVPSYPDDQYYVMSNANGQGSAYMKRYLKPEERSVLCDIGYKVNTTYGSSGNLTNYNYGGSVCPGLQVVGINDGIDPNGVFQHVVSVGSSLPISGFLSNDLGGNSYDCLQDLYGNGTPSPASATSFSYLATTPGIAIVRYVPVSASGVRGNITYIYIYVKSGNCTPSSCSFLNNSTFENSTTCGQMDNMSPVAVTSNCWTGATNTPDIFQRNCLNPSNGLPSQHTIPTGNTYTTSPSDTWSGTPNNTFIGIGSSGGSGTPHWNEGTQSMLNSPLIAGHTYVLSLRAKVANNQGTSFGPVFPAGASGQLRFGGTASVLAPISGPFTVWPSSITSLGTPISIVNDNAWHLFTQTFTYNSGSNLNNFILINTSNMNTLTGQPYVYFFIDDVNITEVLPTTSLTLPNVMCINQTISDMMLYAPVPGGVFAGNGVSASGSTYSFSASAAGVGTHTISYTYTNNNGCVLTIYDDIQVVNSTLTASASAASTNVCTGSSTTLTANSPGAVSYNWNPGNLSGNPVTGPVNATTTYNLTTTNAQGCIATASVNVTAIPLPVISVNPASSSICSGQQVLLTASGANNYTWSPSTGLSATTGASVTASPTSTITYTVNGTSTTTGCTGSATNTITVNACTDCTGGTLLSGNISTSPTAGTTLRVANNITISANVTFTNNAVKIMPGVTITVASNATLNITGSHFYGCQDMWNGIVVQPGGRVNMQPYIVSSTVTKTPFIEDAAVAVDFLPVTTQQSVVMLQVNNSTFNRNGIGIRVQGYAFANAGTMFTVKNSLFTCRDIASTTTSWPLTTNLKAASGNSSAFLNPYIPSGYPVTTLKAPQSTTFSNKGIQLINVGTTTGTSPITYNSVTIGSSVLAEYNVFDYLKTGIHANNSNVKVINTTMQFTAAITNSMVNAGSSPSIGTGVFAENTSGGRFKMDIAGTSAQPNGFYGLYYGLDVKKYNDLQVVYTTIRSYRPPHPPASGQNNGKYGIYADHAKFDNFGIANNTIYNIEKGVSIVPSSVPVGGQVATIKVTNNTFDKDLGSTVGINTQDAIIIQESVGIMNSGGLIWVNNNSIKATRRAITLDNWKRLNIQVNANLIMLGGDGTFLLTPSYGIKLNQCTQGSSASQIYDNTINGFVGSSTNFYGIALDLSIGNDIRCNSVNTGYHGLYFSGNCSPTKTFNNSMENLKYGFVLDNNGIIGQQGSNTVPADNRWLGTNWSTTGTANGSFKNASLNTSSTLNSKMYVRTLTGAYSPLNSTTNFAGTIWYSTTTPASLFAVTSPPNYTACTVGSTPSGSSFFPQVDIVAGMETAVDLANILDGTDPGAVVKNQSYRYLYEDPSLISASGKLNTFYSDLNPTNTGAFQAVEKMVNLGDYVTSTQVISAVIPENLLEESFKRYYEALLNYENGVFTEDDKRAIVDIAQGCPALQGGVVYLAGALYNEVFREAEVFTQVCPSYFDKSAPSSGLELSDTPNYGLYPVPNGGTFYLTGKVSNGDRMRILSMDGKIVCEQELAETEAETEIHTKLSTGTYLVVLQNKSGMELYRNRIVILQK
ncbi:hypothetical protein [Fluviicola sp.]|uniref:hypothetical protein n=1 Tax=Fluviicola sp. TaxID=1917219 RepID=UPI0031D5E1E8